MIEQVVKVTTSYQVGLIAVYQCQQITEIVIGNLWRYFLCYRNSLEYNCAVDSASYGVLLWIQHSVVLCIQLRYLVWCVISL